MFLICARPRSDDPARLLVLPAASSAGLRSIEDLRANIHRYAESLPLLEVEVTALLKAALSQKPPPSANTISAANAVAQSLRAIVSELHQDGDVGTNRRYLLQDGDSFLTQKVALARRNIDGSLLFTNAYAGPLPDDFFRVSELDDNLTPVYITPNIASTDEQVPSLGSVLRPEGATSKPAQSQAPKHKSQDIQFSSAVDFVQYSPFHSFAPESDASNSLMSVKETLESRRRFDPRPMLASVASSLASSSNNYNTETCGATFADIDGVQVPQGFDFAAAKRAMGIDSHNEFVEDSRVRMELTRASLKRLSDMQMKRRSVKKASTAGSGSTTATGAASNSGGPPTVPSAETYMAGKIQDALLHSILGTSRDIQRSGPLRKKSTLLPIHDAFEPVFKGMLHRSK
ncbi:hypothetical protein HDU83_000695 [Entophlyctis luteolus]|nr:hypothetical protein HDU83_000695 [Entophlyctis luteolus]